jgi:hypothetical protein
MILEGFGFVAFFTGVKASSFFIQGKVGIRKAN